MNELQKKILNLTGYHEAGHVVLHVHFGFAHNGLVLHDTCDAQLEFAELPSTDNETVYKFLVVRRASYYSQRRAKDSSPQDRLEAVKLDTAQQRKIANQLYLELAGDTKTVSTANDFVTAALELVDHEADFLVNSAPVYCAVKKVRDFIHRHHKALGGQT